MDLLVKNSKLVFDSLIYDCVIGRDGLAEDKVEGDMKTPVGRFPLRSIYYRADRLQLPQTKLPAHIIKPDCGWCDDPSSAHYNHYIQKPFDGSHEDLWLDSQVYDLLIVIGYNDSPVVRGKGSAVFMHVTPESGYTAGCVGLQRSDLLELVPKLTENSHINILSLNSE